MIMRRASSFLLAAIFAASFLRAESAPEAALLVLSKQDHMLSIVDPVSLRVISRVPVGEDPHEVIASTDGKTAYISNYGFGQFHTLTAIDLVGQKQIGTIDLGALRGPHGLAFVDGKVWFTAEAAKAIGRYDPATGKVDCIVGIGQNRTHMIYVFPDAKRIVTTNVNSGTVTILDRLDTPGGAPKPGAPALPGLPQGAILPPGGDWLETLVPVGTRDEGFDVSPDGKEAWVANAGDGTISVVDLAALHVTDTIEANVPGANRLKITPDGKLVLISAGANLAMLDTATHREVKRLAIGHGSGGILIQPDGTRAYVSFSPDGFVAVIDLKTLTVVGKIDAGGNPDGLAWAVRR